MKKSMQRGKEKKIDFSSLWFRTLYHGIVYLWLDHLLDRYADGEWLTAEELKLLADTSELLNSCIDRKFMQSAVDIIDKDVI